MSAYLIDGQAPKQVVAPTTPAELAAELAEAGRSGAAVIPWGAGTRQHIGNPLTHYDIALSLNRLNRISAYSPPDLVVSVEAGKPLNELQAELAQHNQWLPWDPPAADRATIGGLLASGAFGAQRLGYGTPRDWLLGMRVALGDGRLVRSGAGVVKNVAGYDTHKLHLGAFGSLGVIVEATFKIEPQPEARSTIIAAFLDPRAIIRAIHNLRTTPFHPVGLAALNDCTERNIPALESFLHDQPRHVVLLARYAGPLQSMRRKLSEATQACSEAGARTIEISEQDAAIWSQLAAIQVPTHSDTLLIRTGASQAAGADMARLIEQIPRRYGIEETQRILYAGVGLAHTRWPVAGYDPAQIGAALADLRIGLGLIDGYAVVEEVPPTMRRLLDIWGPAPAGLPLMQALRQRWDPARILNPGRYLV
jgi:glycolate oxidase FAD binding subunit